MTPDVDVIIPVHRPDRPVARAITSLNSEVDLRVLLVLHRLDARELNDYETLRTDPKVCFLHCDDPFPSAAAPRNLALEAVEAGWVAALDSDDWLEPGALAHWVHTGDTKRADAVIPRHKRASGRIVRTPPKRLGHTVLHPVRDRLAYRVGHLGLTRLSAIEDLHLRYGEELSVGEDLFFSYPLWFSGRRIVVDSGPAYVVGDSGEHVSVGHSVDTELASLHRFLTSDLWTRLSLPERRSVGIKFIRGQIISAASNRDPQSLSIPAERHALRATLNAVLDAVPDAMDYMSYADAAIAREILAASCDGQALSAATARRKGAFASPLGLIPTRWWQALHREAPLRFAVSSALVR